MIRVLVRCFSASVLIAGCGHEENKVPPMVDGQIAQREWLSITSEVSAIAECRNHANASQDELFEKVISGMDVGYDLELNMILRKRREEAIDGLSPRLNDDISDRGVHAALLLLKLDEPVGLPYLVKVLDKGTEPQRLRVVSALDQYGSGFDQENAAHTLILGNAGIVSGLLKQLDDGSPELVQAAIQTCGILELPGVYKRFREILQRPGLPARDRVLFWLSKGPLDEDLFEAFLKVLPSPQAGRTSWDTALLEAFAQSTDENIRPRARRELIRFLDGSPDDGSIGFSGDRLGWLKALSDSSGPADIEWLRAMVARERGLYKRDLLARLVRLEGNEGTRRLFSMLDDSETRDVAIAVLQDRFSGSEDQAVVEKLSQLAEQAPRAKLATILSALLAVGGEKARMAVVRQKSKLEATDRARIEATLSEHTLDQILAAVKIAKLLTPAEFDIAQQELESQRAKVNEAQDVAAPSLYGVLSAAKILVAFDAETGQWPNRHDLLLQDFAQASRSIFKPEAAWEEALQRHPEDYDGDYILRFVCDGRLYKGHLRSFGDWYDVERTVSMINRALADSGRPERFISLATGDQIASFVFAVPTSLTPLAKEFHLPLGDDPSEAMQRGVEYERRVLEEYEK